MTSIPAIGTNHAKILAGLKDSRLRKKLAKSNAKKWTTMSQVLQDVADMAVYLKGHMGTHYLHSKFNMFHLLTGPTGQLQKSTQQLSAQQEKPKCWHCQGEHYKKGCLTAPKQNSPTKYKSTK